MNENNLNGPPSPEQARIMGHKGGLARTERKRLAAQLTALKRKKCKNCILPCPLKEQLLNQDLDHTCQVHPVMKGMLTIQTKEDFFNQLKKYLTIYSIKAGSNQVDVQRAFYMLLNLKREFLPEVQRIESKNLNVTAIMQQVDERIKSDIINERKPDNGRKEGVH